jgi:hypothetical protein
MTDDFNLGYRTEEHRRKIRSHSGLSTQEFLANLNVLLAPELPYSPHLTLSDAYLSPKLPHTRGSTDIKRRNAQIECPLRPPPNRKATELIERVKGLQWMWAGGLGLFSMGR